MSPVRTALSVVGLKRCVGSIDLNQIESEEAWRSALDKLTPEQLSLLAVNIEFDKNLSEILDSVTDLIQKLKTETKNTLSNQPETHSDALNKWYDEPLTPSQLTEKWGAELQGEETDLEEIKSTIFWNKSTALKNSF